MKKIKIGLLARIVIAIILGIAIGTVFPAPLVRIFVTFNGIFSEFLNFSIPLIIVGLVTVAIADIGKGAGKMLLVTALIAYFATLFSGFLSYFTGVTVFPSLIEPGAPLEEVSEAQGNPPLLLRLHSATDERNDSSGFSFHTRVRTGVTQQRRIEKCGT